MKKLSKQEFIIYVDGMYKGFELMKEKLKAFHLIFEIPSKKEIKRMYLKESKASGNEHE